MVKRIFSGQIPIVPGFKYSVHLYCALTKPLVLMCTVYTHLLCCIQAVQTFCSDHVSLLLMLLNLLYQHQQVFCRKILLVGEKFWWCEIILVRNCFGSERFEPIIACLPLCCLLDYSSDLVKIMLHINNQFPR